MATLYIRLSDDAASRVRRSATNRGLTLGAYLEALQDLRETCSMIVQEPDPSVSRSFMAGTIEALGLAMPTED